MTVEKIMPIFILIFKKIKLDLLKFDKKYNIYLNLEKKVKELTNLSWILLNKPKHWVGKNYFSHTDNNKK